ncbi:MAG: amidohydrolase family protein [Armatimonadota bacterium]|nr:amidohydrolase family protein [Armatimonadota bacterium]MDR7453640.1 amidohydrolase family protein [Armatimonadota bacterium]MDR7457150.1 amidohydrolase family protein [Armatimonadota bacterium]MDR7497109.1 amidohydrolase family protein [Armatimonadota bacterium]MDR7511406.1 amidohydrolase family protein [Armatimonadota bacterium]
MDGSRIVSVGRAPAGGARRDCSGCVILPGNVCGHTHLYSTLARGVPYGLEAPSNFVQILQRVWWRLDRALDEEAVRASALVGGAAALLAGTTTVVDHHASPSAIDGSLDVIADALETLGLRAILCYEVSDRDGPERAAAGLRENRRFLAARRRLARGLFGAHASFTLSEETLGACVDGARAAGVGVHIHVAEDAADQRDALARFGVRVTTRLARAGALGPDALLAHCIHLDAAEVETLRASGAAVAHNPTSNMNNTVGHTPVGLLGEAVVVGTDGIGADMFVESKTAYFRARDEDRTVGPAWPLARLAAAARLAGRCFGEPALGTVEPGAPADLVVLAYDPPTPLVADTLAGHWTFGLGACHVRDVMVAGELVVADRRLTRMDAGEIAAQARAAAGRLWRRLEAIAPHPFEPAGGRA